MSATTAPKTMSKDEIIEFRNEGLKKKVTNLQSNNVKGTAVGYLGIHYSRYDVNRYLQSATSEVIALALAEQGHINLFVREYDGKQVFSTITDGKVDAERTLPPASDVQAMVESYCDKESITPDGQPLTKKAK